MLTNYHTGCDKTALDDPAAAAANRLPVNALRFAPGKEARACRWAQIVLSPGPSDRRLNGSLLVFLGWSRGILQRARSDRQSVDIWIPEVIRWVEGWVQRSGEETLPTIQKLWGFERGQPGRLERLEAIPAESRITIRLVNFVLALVALVLLLPVLALVALLVRCTSSGPVLYTQVRVGHDRRFPAERIQNHRRERDLGGRPFTIYKFRTMWVDAEHASGAVWAQQSDPRVTPIGRLLRQYRLDELPQLFNVLKGEMNIVGPRPERPTIFAELREHIAEYPLRQRAKPGITGLAQINHHYDRSLEDVRTKVHYDLEYIRRQSVTEDLRIMLMTVPVVLLRRGGW
jgi:lipopolysaccharide/colanic/teichoic acid biosynthesis glycosyltransferase